MNEIDWEKRARELCYEVFKEHRDSILFNSEAPSWTDQALKLGHEMADARAEEIALRLQYEADSGNWHDCAGIARSFIDKKKTREEVLEEALRAIEAGCPPGWKNTDPRDWSLTRDGGERAAAVARRALEWKDTDRHP